MLRVPASERERVDHSWISPCFLSSVLCCTLAKPLYENQSTNAYRARTNSITPKTNPKVQPGEHLQQPDNWPSWPVPPRTAPIKTADTTRLAASDAHVSFFLSADVGTRS